VLSKLTIIKLYVFTVFFIAVNMFFVYHDSFLIHTIPFALAFGLLAFLSLRHFMLILVFCVPFSIELSVLIPDASFDMSLPTEPFLFGVMGMFFLKLLTEQTFDKRVLVHPISISIYLYVVWLLITTITSEMPIVSLKYVLVRVWFVVNFYFLVTQLVRDKSYISKYIWAYTFGLLIVIAITIFNHANHGFTQKAGHFVMHPFFKDHTSYGAVLAMILPAILVLLRFGKDSFNVRFMHVAVICILVLALVLSYTRAAWGSVVIIVGVWFVIKMGIKLRSLVFIGILSIAVVYPFLHDIQLALSKNDEVSSTDFSSHVKSMSNISTDASNLERINRWNCALRMFEQRPVFGWGPGTYMFLYAPFQHSKDRTIISTNAADLGNAHSEYLGLLSEAGLFGMLSFLIIIFVTLHVAFRLYHKSSDEFVKQISLFLVLGLITYYIHGFLNNFLDTDKVAALFWSFMAIIVSLDIESKETESIHQNIS